MAIRFANSIMLCREENRKKQLCGLELSKRNVLIGFMSIIATVIIIAWVSIHATGSNDKDRGGPILTSDQRVEKILKKSPIIEGYNYRLFNILPLTLEDLETFNVSPDVFTLQRKGHAAAQVLPVYVNCSSPKNKYMQNACEKIDWILGLEKKLAKDFKVVKNCDEMERVISEGKIATVIGLEGGHVVGSKLSNLRNLYRLGVRCMTLTHSCSSSWAASSIVDNGGSSTSAEREGLTERGVVMIREMNRLGMIIDLSRTSQRTMEKVLKYSKAPVIFSHASAKALCNHSRNVPDSVLERVKATKSLVMVYFHSRFIRCDGQKATVEDVVEHINYFQSIAGMDHVGLGGGYGGATSFPEGLEDESKYPVLIKALVETGHWSDEDLEKLTGGNFFRVFRAVEKVRDSQSEVLQGPDTEIVWLKGKPTVTS